MEPEGGPGGCAHPAGVYGSAQLAPVQPAYLPPPQPLPAYGSAPWGAPAYTPPAYTPTLPDNLAGGLGAGLPPQPGIQQASHWVGELEWPQGGHMPPVVLPAAMQGWNAPPGAPQLPLVSLWRAGLPWPALQACRAAGPVPQRPRLPS